FYRSWSKALVVKVLERSFSFGAVKRRLETLWARNGEIQVSDASNSFFLVRFADSNDYQRAAFQGPWKIFDYYFSVARWSPYFNEEEPLKTLLMWVRLPKLPIHFFNQVAITRIGDCIGRTVRLDLVGFPLTQHLGVYLGVPILHERTSARTYQCILDRIDQKLAGWKVKSLSLAGRVTLAQSVLSAIPAYVMQTAVIPVSTCEEIDRRIRNFVWGSTSEERKIHLVAWERICLPKEDGGLGLKMARELNRAYMMKEPEKLWVKVIQGKYFRDVGNGLERRSLSSYSPLWKGISKEWQPMLIGARSAIRNGLDTHFWMARWVDSGIRLLDLVEEGEADIDISASVAEFTNDDHQWDVDKLSSVLTPDQVSFVVGMSPPNPDSGEDEWVWGMEPNGQFSIKSAYRVLLS
ncbi:Putative ribonuclease H protein At1g65750, partial [Linum perenne]